MISGIFFAISNPEIVPVPLASNLSRFCITCSKPPFLSPHAKSIPPISGRVNASFTWPRFSCSNFSTAATPFTPLNSSPKNSLSLLFLPLGDGRSCLFFSPTPKAAMSFCGVSENLRTASRVFCSVGFIGKLAVPTTPDTCTHASAQMFADAVENYGDFYTPTRTPKIISDAIRIYEKLYKNTRLYNKKAPNLHKYRCFFALW